MSTVALLRAQPTFRLLDDGHVEIAHTCNGEMVSGLLPSPPWRRVEGDLGVKVEPSVHCTACGLHSWVGLPGWTQIP